MNQDHQFYSENLIWDTDFRAWVLNPTWENYRIWSHWLEENPDRAEAAEQARDVILALQCQEPSLQDWEITARTNELKDQIS